MNLVNLNLHLPKVCWCYILCASLLITSAAWKALTGTQKGSFQCLACTTAYHKDVVLEGKRTRTHESSSAHKRALKSIEKTPDPLTDAEQTSMQGELVRGPLTELLAEMANPSMRSEHVDEWVDPMTGTVDWNSDMMDVDLTNNDATYIRIGMELGGKLHEYLLNDGALEEPSDTEINDYSSDEGGDGHNQGWWYSSLYNVQQPPTPVHSGVLSSMFPTSSDLPATRALPLQQSSSFNTFSGSSFSFSDSPQSHNSPSVSSPLGFVPSEHCSRSQAFRLIIVLLQVLEVDT